MVSGLMSENNKILKKWFNLLRFVKKNEFNNNKYWDLLLNNKIPCFSINSNSILKKFLDKNFVIHKNINLNTEYIKKIIFKIDAIRLIYFNGKLIKDFSSNDFSPFNIKVVNKIKKYQSEEFFLYLINSLSNEHTEISIPNNTTFLKPLYFLYINGGRKKTELNNAFYSKNLFVSRGSKINVIEHYVSLNKNSNFTGSNLKIILEEHSQLNYTKIFHENSNSYCISYNDVTLSHDNFFKNLNFLLGGNIILQKNNTKLNGISSNFIAKSLILPVHNEFINLDFNLKHNASHCHSHQLHKTIAMEKSTVIFNGLINVSKNATKTDGKLINNNLILNEKARVYTTPKLEIYSSDVKCSHGATIGRIDENQIFYLQSRGIKKFLAKRMIIFSFSYDLIQEIENKTLNKDIFDKINNRLGE